MNGSIAIGLGGRVVGWPPRAAVRGNLWRDASSGMRCAFPPYIVADGHEVSE